MRIPIYQLDAFTNRVFSGNPAAVCLLDDWLPTEIMQAIAAENNLSETAFCVPNGGEYGIRWFTLRLEVDLAGHPTLAAAWVIVNEVEPGRAGVTFISKTGDVLEIHRDGPRLAMNFPSRPPTREDGLEAMRDALGGAPVELLAARDGFAVYADAAAVRSLTPDMVLLGELDRWGCIATAPGEDCDFVSRFFAPAAGIPEDPVTGSAHCTLIPYWAERLGKKDLFARQISPRGGEIHCSDLGDRVRISGEVAPYMQGTITVEI